MSLGCVLVPAMLFASDEPGFPAVVKADKMAVLSSQMDGVVIDVQVVPGDTFLQGDPLLTMDCTLPQATLDKARAQVEYTRNEYKSIKALNALNSATKVQLARSAAEFAIAKADTRMAQYQVDQCVLSAPFDGTVVQSWVMPHESIQLKKELIQIASNTALSVEFLAPSSHLTQLTIGRPISLRIVETGLDYELTIDKVIPVVDSVSQTIRVVSRITNEKSLLWPGMSGWVSSASKDAQGN